MAYWGRSTTNGSPFTTGFQRAMGGQFGPADQQLDALDIYCSGDGVAEVRVGVYVGGTASDPTGATLLEDLGKITPPATAGWVTAASLVTPTIPADSIVWIYLHGTSATSVYASTASADAGDFFADKGRGSFSSTAMPADTAPPATLGSATFADYWYSWRIEHSSAAASTAGISSKALERNGVSVTSETADVMVFSGTSLTGTPVHEQTAVALSSGVLPAIDLSATALAVNDPVVVVILPATGGPGLAIATTVEALA